MWRIIVVLIVILPLLGCGGRKQDAVSGKITYKGQPLNGVMLRFYPIPDGQPIPIPVTQEGTFRTTGVPPGEYKVVVDAPAATKGMPAMPKSTGDPAKDEQMKQKYQQAYQQQPPTISYPNKYKELVSSDLKCTITESYQPINLELTD